MLAFHIRYLSGICYSAQFHDRTVPEWPPHPARLFSALMAVCYEREIGETGLAALRWLEALPDPPQLHASHAVQRSSHSVAVPVNDPENVKKNPHPLPEYRSRGMRYFPCVVPETPDVWMIWPNVQPDMVTRETLQLLAEHVVYLGSSRSLVAVTLDDRPPAPTLIPAEVGDTVLRVVAAGRVEELIQRYDLGLRPTPGLYHHYQTATETVAPPPQTGEFGELIVLRQTKGSFLSLSNSLSLIERMRQAALSVAGDTAPAALHGHGQHVHVAWAPLAFVGSPHADGHLLGVGLVLPKAIDRVLRRRLLVIAALLKVVRLQDGRYCEFASTTLEERRYTLQQETWSRASRLWTSVTPIVLPHYPKARRTMETIIAETCRHSRIPEPAEVIVHRHGRLTGTPPSAAFRVQRANHGPQRLWTHATLRFDGLVQGPVILGAGRYFGLGLCRPLPDEGRHAPGA